MVGKVSSWLTFYLVAMYSLYLVAMYSLYYCQENFLSFHEIVCRVLYSAALTVRF